MDLSNVDIGVIVAIIGMIIKSAQDKAIQAEQMGRLKQQVQSLEARGGRWDERFNDIERDLSDIKASLARVETVLAHIEQR
jgi:DNA repair exonuclease SbcCD ATPase subunit